MHSTPSLCLLYIQDPLRIGKVWGGYKSQRNGSLHPSPAVHDTISASLEPRPGSATTPAGHPLALALTSFSSPGQETQLLGPQALTQCHKTHTHTPTTNSCATPGEPVSPARLQFSLPANLGSFSLTLGWKGRQSRGETCVSPSREHCPWFSRSSPELLNITGQVLAAKAEGEAASKGGQRSRRGQQPNHKVRGHRWHIAGTQVPGCKDDVRQI